jgi:SPP1 gp7 family putative phage head morphogenesis protein
MPEKNVKMNLGRVPFDRAIEYLREKIDVGTRAYSDLMHGAHDTAFVVAGLTKGEILSDVHKLVVKAIQEGTPFDRFQKDFAKTIEGRWLPSPSPARSKSAPALPGGAPAGPTPRTPAAGAAATGWRAKIIYQTNIRTAYAAGRHEQLQRIKATHPYWQYRHGDSRKPREEHLAWDGLVLRADDPWWKTHYPPNGWGCRCYVHALDDIDLREMGKKGPDEAPPSPLRTVKYGDRTVEVPVGIDPGWAYVPGETVSLAPSGQLLPDVNGPNAPQDGLAQARERQLERMPPDIAERVKAEIALMHQNRIDALQYTRRERLHERIGDLPPGEARQRLLDEIAKLPSETSIEERLDEVSKLVSDAELKSREDENADRAEMSEELRIAEEKCDQAEEEFNKAKCEADKARGDHIRAWTKAARLDAEAKKLETLGREKEAKSKQEEAEAAWVDLGAKEATKLAMAEKEKKLKEIFKEADRMASRIVFEPAVKEVCETLGKEPPSSIRFWDSRDRNGYVSWEASWNHRSRLLTIDDTSARRMRRLKTMESWDGGGFFVDPETHERLRIPSTERMRTILAHELVHDTYAHHGPEFHKLMYEYICKLHPERRDWLYAWEPGDDSKSPYFEWRERPNMIFREDYLLKVKDEAKTEMEREMKKREREKKKAGRTEKMLAKWKKDYKRIFGTNPSE